MRFLSSLLVVAGAALFLGTQSIASLGQKLCVTSKYIKTGLVVRSQPSKDADIVIIIGAGRAVIEFERQDGWIDVGVERAGGRTGYVPVGSVSAYDLDGMTCGS